MAEYNKRPATPNFGIEVQEVPFQEFDRRKERAGEPPTPYERRGFLSEVDNMIKALYPRRRSKK
jgi:hypothetical protein